MSEPTWVSPAALELLHDESLKEHGGAEGVGDSGLPDSTLAPAQNFFAYEDVDDPCRLAATYAFGIVKNHPFVDGNKRAAFIAAGLCLQMNGARLHADRAEAVLVMLDLASGELTELQFAEWLRKNARPKDQEK